MAEFDDFPDDKASVKETNRFIERVEEERNFQFINPKRKINPKNYENVKDIKLKPRPIEEEEIESRRTYVHKVEEEDDDDEEEEEEEEEEEPIRVKDRESWTESFLNDLYGPEPSSSKETKKKVNKEKRKLKEMPTQLTLQITICNKGK